MTLRVFGYNVTEYPCGHYHWTRLDEEPLESCPRCDSIIGVVVPRFVWTGDDIVEDEGDDS